MHVPPCLHHLKAVAHSSVRRFINHRACVLIALLSIGKALIRKEMTWEYQVSVKPVFGENLHRHSYLMLQLWHVADPGVSRTDLYKDRSNHHGRQ